jgi:hypothetical protein
MCTSILFVSTYSYSKSSIMQQVKACAYTAPANSLSPLSLHTLIPSDELGISSLGGDSRHSQTRVSTSPSADVYPASPSLARIQRKERKKNKKKGTCRLNYANKIFPLRQPPTPLPDALWAGCCWVRLFMFFFLPECCCCCCQCLIFFSLSLGRR